MQNGRNRVCVSAFTGNLSDDELAAHLSHYLARLNETSSIRKVEKRNWRAQRQRAQ